MLVVKDLNWFAKLADFLMEVFVMYPIMWLSGARGEYPQRTHFWNNTKIIQNDISYLLDAKMVEVKFDLNANERGKVRFHIPFIGGWKRYVVLTAVDEGDLDWYVGWVCNDVIGYSRIPIRGSIRVLAGDSDVEFFGIRKHGSQVLLMKVGEGVIGSDDTESQKWKRLPLH